MYETNDCVGHVNLNENKIQIVRNGGGCGSTFLTINTLPLFSKGRI